MRHCALLVALLALGCTRSVEETGPQDVATSDAVGARATPTRPPNIIWVMADDVGYGDPRCYNPDSAIPTPNIDRIAAEGVRMTDAHSPSAVCSPTRYGVLTGRYSWRSRLKRGVLWGRSPLLVEEGRVTVASLLRERGYRTGAFGKWHLGLGRGEETDYGAPLRPGPLDLGFDVFYGIPASLDMEPYVYVDGDRPERPATETTPGSDLRRRGGGGFWRAGPIAPEFVHEEVLGRVSDRAIETVERWHAEAPDEPFFLYFPLTAPHTPWVPPRRFQGMSDAGWYGDFVVEVDHVVGRVLDVLDRLELADDTLVIFTSDNGAHWEPGDLARFPHRANGDLRGQKADIWEAGHRVPFVARWPGQIPAGSTSDETICHTDLLATCAALTGAALPDDAGEDSFDVGPALRGDERDAPIREATVHHSFHGVFAIRRGPWKLIFGRGSGGFSQPAAIEPRPGEPVGQLYHLGDDPGEQRNLFEDEPELVVELIELLERYRREGRSRF